MESKKQKDQLYVTSDECIERIREQLHKLLKTRDPDEGLILAAMLMQLKEHRLPCLATHICFIRTEEVECHRDTRTTVDKLVRSWPLPKEFFREGKS